LASGKPRTLPLVSERAPRYKEKDEHMEVGDPAHERAPSETSRETSHAMTRAINRALPPLSVLTAVAAVLHLAIYRVLLPILASQKRPLPTLLLVSAPFALNLAACAGLIGFVAASIDFVRDGELAPASRRVLIGFLAAVIVSTLILATFAPSAQVGPHQIFLATGALHTLAIQLAICTLRVQRSLSGRITASLIAAASAFPLVSLLLRQWDPLGALGAGKGLASLHGLGELAYLLVPIAAAFVLVPWGEDKDARRARTLGAIATGVMALLFTLAMRLPHAMYGHILYSSLRLEWALERASLGYAVPVSLATGAALASSVSKDPTSRQGGIGLFLWLAAGYNPLTPARLLVAALGISLICRAVISAPSHPRAEQPES